MIEGPRLSIGEYGETFLYTQEEREALIAYKGIDYKIINSLLSNSDGEYERRTKLFDIPHSSADIEHAIGEIPRVYLAALKSQLRSGRGRTVLHRGTSRQEVDSLRNGGVINNVLSTSSDPNGSDLMGFVFIDNSDSPAQMRITCEPRSIDHSYNRIYRFERTRKRNYNSSIYKSGRSGK